MFQNLCNRIRLMVAEVPSEFNINRLPGVAFVLKTRLDLVLPQQQQDFVKKAPRQCQKLRNAANHSRLVIGRQSHCLSLVEFGILESGEPGEAIRHRLRQSGLVDEKEVAANNPNRYRKRTGNWFFWRPPRWRQQPWVFERIFIDRAHPHTDHVSRFLDAANDSFDYQRFHPGDARQVTPLIADRFERIVKENTVAGLARDFL
jgi:hypothetical protein